VGIIEVGIVTSCGKANHRLGEDKLRESNYE